MKSLLQSIGVLQKDAESATSVPEAVVEVTPVQAPVVTEVSINIPSGEACVDPAVFEHIECTIINGVRNRAGLSPLFEFLDSFEKLKRVNDPKERMLTACDLAGYDGTTLLGFAERYTGEVKKAAEVYFNGYKLGKSANIGGLKNLVDNANKVVVDLREKLAKAEDELDDYHQKLVDEETDVARNEQAAHAAAEVINTAFDKIHAGMKETFK